MEKNELEETNEASSHAVVKLEGDALAIENEDRDEQSKGEKIPCIGDDDHELGNGEEDISDKIISQAIEKLEGDDSAVQNEDHKEPRQEESQNICHDEPGYENERDDILDEVSSQAIEKMEGDAFTIQCEDHGIDSKEEEAQSNGYDSPGFEIESDDISDNVHEMVDVETNTPKVKDNVTGILELAQRVDESRDLQCESLEENMEGDAFTTFTIQSEDHSEDSKKEEIQNIGNDGPEFEKQSDEVSDNLNEVIDVEYNTPKEVKDNVTGVVELAQREDEIRDLQCEAQDENLETGCSSNPGELFHKEHETNSMTSEIVVNIVGEEYSDVSMDSSEDLESKREEVNRLDDFRQNDLVEEKDEDRKTNNTSNEDNNLVPAVNGVEVLNLDADPGTPRVVEKAAAVTNFVREKSVVAVTTLLRRLSGKIDEGSVDNSHEGKGVSDLLGESESQEVKTVDAENKTDQKEEPITEGPLQPIAMKGRIILYTRLGCQESKEVRQYLYMKRLRYVEINIDVYPSRKMELEKISGSTSVPKVFFNEILIGGLSELKTLSESGKLDEKIDYLITEFPSFEGPFPPLSGEDDLSNSGALDEMALIVRKMKDSIVVRDRFSKLRRFTSCFLGSEAVDFLSADQYLERKEAVEFGRKLASKLFFQHVLEENLFEDGNHFYRFLDDDPIVASQCQNIPRGIITVKPKPITELASRLRFLSYAMFEAYASHDGRHIDYRSMHGSEEFARYLRIVEELQRVEILDLSREEKLAFFINLYNMMTIHAILVWGHPAGALERRKLFADFKYVIGGSTYSLSVIQNGILRGNQRPPYTLMKPFGAKDKRLRVALSFCEPLVHFALVCGTRSGPALRCYSPGDIDKELMDAARDFLRNGGLLIDFPAKVAYASKILKWFSIDFGKTELEVVKHVSIYLDPAESELLLDLLASATTELKVIYQPYDWGLNC